MSIAQNFPAISPSLLLDFANVQALDSRITFARATTATYYGTRTALAEQNLVLYSQEFDNAAWGKTGLTVTANSTAAPDGTTTADTLTGASTSNAVVFNGAAVAVTANTYTSSVFIKAGTADFGVLSIWTGSATNGANLWFNAQTGALTGSSSVTAGYTITASSSTALSAGWFRITVSATVPTANIYLSVRIVDTDNAFVYTSTVGKTLFLWGAQLEQRSTVTAYTPTTTQPITNYVPVLETAASNVARFDHNPTTFESLGLLIEEQRTNLVTYSEQFDNAAWTKTNATIATNTIIAPDGTLTGDAIVEGTGTVSPLLLGGSGFLAVTGNAISLYVKAVAGGATRYVYIGAKIAANTRWGYFLFNPATGTVAGGPFNDGIQNVASSPTVTSVGNGWYRISIIFTSPLANQVFTIGLTNTTTPTNAAILGSYTGDGYSGIYIWGAQNEAGAFATSYIPTVASQVTRAADSASMVGTNFTSWYNAAEGTVYSESVCGAKTASGHLVAGISDGSINNALYINQYISTNIRNSVRANATDQAILGKGTAPVSGVSYKSAMAYKVNDIAASFDGEAIQTDTLALIPFDVNRLTLGNLFSGSSQPLNGHIKKLSYYPIRLSNTNLVALTG